MTELNFSKYLQLIKLIFYPPVFVNIEFALFWIHSVGCNELDNLNAIMYSKLLSIDHLIINEYKTNEIN